MVTGVSGFAPCSSAPFPATGGDIAVGLSMVGGVLVDWVEASNLRSSCSASCDVASIITVADGDVAVDLSVVGELGDGERVSDFRLYFCGDVVVSRPCVKVASCPFANRRGGLCRCSSKYFLFSFSCSTLFW